MDIASGSPAKLASEIYRIVRRVVGVDDPFSEIKRECNRHALDAIDAVEKMLPSSLDELEKAVHLSIVGNVIDFGTEIHIDLEGTARRGSQTDFAINEIELLRRKIKAARKVLYLADNAGEIVFDRRLLALLGGEGRALVMAVKGGPVINDAMREDAEAARAQEFGRVIDNGTDAVGTQLENCSQEFLEEWTAADLIISKGQANAESLLGLQDERVFFLYLIKCEVMARFLGFKPLEFIAATALTLYNRSVPA